MEPPLVPAFTPALLSPSSESKETGHPHVSCASEAAYSDGEKRRRAMFVNCYDGYGLCLFAVRVKEGVQPEKLGDHIYHENDLVDFWQVTDEPNAAVVRY